MPGSGPVTVLVADDHRLMREGTAALLGADPRIEVVAWAATGREAVERALEHRPAVALLDLNMPEMRGTEACAAIRERLPDTEVLILTVSEHEPDLYAALRVGAAGYLLKDMPPGDLVDAVLGAGAGEPLVPARMASRLLDEFGSSEGAPASPLAELSDREREVLALVGEGMPNKLIARRLEISEKTVKAHLTRVYAEIGVTDRTQAALWARGHGIGSDEG